MNSNSLNLDNFEMKTYANVKIWLFTKLRTQNKILASKMPNFKQQTTRTSYPEKVHSMHQEMRRD